MHAYTAVNWHAACQTVRSFETATRRSYLYTFAWCFPNSVFSHVYHDCWLFVSFRGLNFVIPLSSIILCSGFSYFQIKCHMNGWHCIARYDWWGSNQPGVAQRAEREVTAPIVILNCSGSSTATKSRFCCDCSSIRAAKNTPAPQQDRWKAVLARQDHPNWTSRQMASKTGNSHGFARKRIML